MFSIKMKKLQQFKYSSHLSIGSIKKMNASLCMDINCSFMFVQNLYLCSSITRFKSTMIDSKLTPLTTTIYISSCFMRTQIFFFLILQLDNQPKPFQKHEYSKIILTHSISLQMNKFVDFLKFINIQAFKTKYIHKLTNTLPTF